MNISDPKIYLTSSVSVVCHDAGATNLIIGWLKDLPEINVRVCVSGPAKLLWNQAFPDSINYTLDDVIENCTLLLSGSGWQSQLEHQARLLAKEKDIYSIAVVDHWVNYIERFRCEGILQLPNEIWVSDQYAAKIAEDVFDNIIVRLMPNKYINELVETTEVLDKSRIKESNIHVLYALEPIRKDWLVSDTRAGEFQALDFFISNLNSFGLPDSVEIHLRPHPPDPVGKYDEWCKNQKKYNVELANNEPLVNAISWSDWVVGCESYVLLVALAAKRKVASTLPPWAPKISIPHEGILHLRDLV